MRYFVLFFTTLILLTGCANRTSVIEKELNREIKLTIYNQPVQDLFIHQGSSDIFHRFPFIDKREFEVKGKFPKDFYKNITLVYNAKSIKKVDFWELAKSPKSLNFIYIEPIWIKEYRRLTGDLYANIAYSLNISAKEQEILRNWVEQGGVLWVEFGLFSTRYDIFNKEGEISSYKIKKSLQDAFVGLRFWQNPIQSYLFKAKKIDLINFMPTEKSFLVDEKESIIKGIKRLKVVIDNYMEMHVLINGEKLLVDKEGRPLVTLVKYGKGYVISLLPFEYTDVYYDGELLRWKLLFYLLKKL